jgi:hypothetical protein
MKFLIILMVFSAISCDITENRNILINNNSKDSITCFVTTNNIQIKPKNVYNEMYVDLIKNDFGMINPIRQSWEEYIKQCDGNLIRLYIIKQDSINKYGWEKIRAKEIYNKKYLFKIKDLDQINWSINYID